MIQALMADDSTHHPGCFEPDFEAQYIHWDGSRMGDQKLQTGLYFELSGPGLHTRGRDMGAWDEDSDAEDWPTLEGGIDEDQD
jgi:hypothetical protein